jgi:hypothetical protein
MRTGSQSTTAKVLLAKRPKAPNSASRRPPPTAGEIIRQPVEQGAGRTRQQDEPDDHRKNVPMRGDQRFLHRQAGDLGGVEPVGRAAAPLAQQGPRALRLSHAQRQVDVGVVVAELAEAQRQVEDRHVPGKAEQRIHRRQGEIQRSAGNGGRQHGQQPGNRAMALLAVVEMPSKKRA